MGVVVNEPTFPHRHLAQILKRGKWASAHHPVFLVAELACFGFASHRVPPPQPHEEKLIVGFTLAQTVLTAKTGVTNRCLALVFVASEMVETVAKLKS